MAIDHDCLSDLENSKALSGSSSAERMVIEETQQHPIKGLKNNIYHIENSIDYMKQKVRQLEDSIEDKKQQWIQNNITNWYQSTPQIYDYHKQADKKLHSTSQNQTFVSIRRVHPKLP